MERILVFLLIVILIFFPVLGYGQESQVQISVSATVAGEVPPPSPPPAGGGALLPPVAKAIFQGRAYPKAFLTILKDGKVAATFFAESSGLFRK